MCLCGGGWEGRQETRHSLRGARLRMVCTRVSLSSRHPLRWVGYCSRSTHEEIEAGKIVGAGLWRSWRLLWRVPSESRGPGSENVGLTEGLLVILESPETVAEFVCGPVCLPFCGGRTLLRVPQRSRDPSVGNGQALEVFKQWYQI